MDASFSKETGGSTYSVKKNINSLAQVPFECVPGEAYKGTRRKHNIKFRQIGHTSHFFLNLLVHGMGFLSLKLRHWLYLSNYPNN